MKHKEQVGDGRKIRLKPCAVLEKIKDTQIKSTQLATHPEEHFLRKFSWEGMLTIRFESASYSLDNNVAELRRDDFVRLLMDNLIRYKWRLRPKHVNWVATTEYGISGVAHCHILFNFLPLEKAGNPPPDIDNLLAVASESLDHICDLVDCPVKSVDLDWQPKFYDLGLVAYFSKKELGRQDKHFIWSNSRWSIDPETNNRAWLGALLKEVKQDLAKEVIQ